MHFMVVSMLHVYRMMVGQYLCPLCTAVSDVDGDTVRCRWAESAQGECGGVCQVFPAELDQVC